MRHLNFFFLLFVGGFFSLNTFAQPDQGNLHVGGSSGMDLSFGSSSSKVTLDDGDSEDNDGPNRTSFSFNPSAGYFLADGLVVGGNINLMASSETDTRTRFTVNGKEEIDTKTNTFQWTFGPYARYYTDFNLFGHAGIGFGTRSTTEFVDGDETESSKDDEADGLLRWSVGAGYALFLGGNEQVALEPMISYNHRRVSIKPTGDNVDSRTQSSGNVGLRLGISVFL